MVNSSSQSNDKKRSAHLRWFILFFPLLFGVVICASTTGLNWLRQDRLEYEVEVLSTADYSPWEQTRFAPIRPELATEVALQRTNLPDYVVVGIATDVADSQPTIVVQAPTDDPNTREDEPAEATSTPTLEATLTPAASETAVPTVTDEPTAIITVTATVTSTTTQTATSTPVPSVTNIPTNTPLPTATLIPTNTSVPLPTNTPLPTATPIPFIAAPQAAFDVTPSGGIAPLAVSFVNQSTGSITNYSWNYGDGSPISTAVTAPPRTYNTPGTYVVLLTVTGPGGSSTSSRTVTVSAPPATDADLNLSKAASVTSANVGDTFTYTLTASNAGPIQANNVVIVDTLPAQVTFVSSPQCAAAGQNLSCAMGSIASGGNATATVTVQAGSAGTAVNTATVSATEPDPNTGNNSASATVTINTVVQNADIEIVSYSPNTTTPNEGETVTITLTVRNNGPVAADNVSIGAATGDAGLTITNYAPAQGTVDAGQWNIGSMAVGQTINLVITATVDAGTAGTTITRTRSVTNSSITDNIPGNNTRSFTLNLQATPGADVEIVTFTTSNLNPIEDDTIEITVTVRNNGTSTATGVVVAAATGDPVTGILSDGFPSATQGTYDAGTDVWTVGTLAPSDTATLTLSVIDILPGAGGSTITRSRTVSANEFDPDLSNNTNSYTLTVQSEGAELAVGMFAANDTPLENGSVNYTVSVTNSGPLNATGIAVQMSWTSGFINNPGGTALMGSYNSGTRVWTIPNLNNGQTAILFLNFTTGFDIEGSTQTATAEITAADQPDPITANNIASFSVTIQDATGLFLSKTASATTVNVGQTFDYIFEVENIGPSDTTNVVITDILPAEVSFVSSASCVASGQNVTCNLGALADGAIATATLTVMADAPGVVTNTANVTSDLPDGNLTNNQDSVNVTINGGDADLEFSTFSFNSTNPAVGETVTATLQIVNNGPSQATNIRLGPSNGTGAPGNSIVDTISHGSYVANEWNIPTLNSGETATLTLDITVEAAAAGTTVSRWREIVASDQPDPDSTPNNGVDTEDDYNSYTVTVQPLSSVDLSLTKSAPGAVTVSNNFDYTFTVTNNGGTDATNVTITDTLPAEVSFVSSAECVASGQDIICDLGTILASGTANATITVQAVTPGTVTNTAIVTLSEIDANPADNSDSAVVDIIGADVAITDVALTAAMPLGVGDNFNFVVTYTNLGSANLAANDAVVSYTMPAELSYGGFSTGATCTLVVSTLTCQLSNPVNSGTSEIFTINMDAVSATSSPVMNTFNAISPYLDTNGANNAFGVLLDIKEVDIAITSFTVDNPTPSLNDSITYTMIVTNNGPSSATGLVIENTIPTGLTYDSWSPTVGTYAAGLWSIGTLSSGATAVLTINATVNASGVTITNSASVNAVDEPDFNTGNDSNSVDVAIP